VAACIFIEEILPHLLQSLWDIWDSGGLLLWSRQLFVLIQVELFLKDSASASINFITINTPGANEVFGSVYKWVNSLKSILVGFTRDLGQKSFGRNWSSDMNFLILWFRPIDWRKNSNGKFLIFFLQHGEGNLGIGKTETLNRFLDRRNLMFLLLVVMHLAFNNNMDLINERIYVCNHRMCLLERFQLG